MNDRFSYFFQIDDSFDIPVFPKQVYKLTFNQFYVIKYTEKLKS